MASERETVLVTGAGSGIGRATAIAMAEAGRNVVCADINQEAAETVAATVRQHGVDALALKADVGDVGGTGEEPNQSAIVKRRGDHGDVMEMAGAFPRIVGDVDVTFKDVLATYAADEMANRIRHGIDVTGRAGDGLGQHLAFQIVNAGRQVAGFTHGCRKGGANQSLCLFFND